MLARGAAASAALVRGAPWALGAQRARPAGALTSCGAARAPHTALRAQSTLIARTAHVPVCMRGFAAQRSCLAAWLASGEAHTQATARRVARASRPHQRVCSSWAGDGAASTSPFKTTRLPSLQTHYRTVAGVEETTAIIEEVASQVQQFAPAAESIAGRLSPRTARELARALAADTGDAIARPPNGQTLFLLGLSSCVPFIGFGFVDNAVMILAGDMVEKSMLHILPISTLAAAGLGNMLSDVMGVGLGGVIESFAARLGVEAPPLTRAQQQLTVSRFTVHAGSAIGISIGCLIGMFPLLLLNRDEEEIHRQVYHHGESDVNEHGVADAEPHSHSHSHPHSHSHGGHAAAAEEGASGAAAAKDAAATAASEAPAHAVTQRLVSLSSAAQGLRPFLASPRSVAFYEYDAGCGFMYTLAGHSHHHSHHHHNTAATAGAGKGAAVPHAAAECDDPALLGVIKAAQDGTNAAGSGTGASSTVAYDGGRAMVAVRGVGGAVVGVLEVRYGKAPTRVEADGGEATKGKAKAKDADKSKLQHHAPPPATEVDLTRVEMAGMQLSALATALGLSGAQPHDSSTPQ